jgi:hypothetical protein
VGIRSSGANHHHHHQQQQQQHGGGHTQPDGGCTATTISGSSSTSYTGTCVSLAEVAWCSRHHLIHASLANVADTLAVVLAVVHQFRPSFLHLYCSPQQYYQQQGAHVCSTSVTGDVKECGGCRDLAVQVMHDKEQRDKLRSLLVVVRRAGAGEGVGYGWKDSNRKG